MKMINYTEHSITERDINTVNEVLIHEQIAGNSRTVQEFEDALCEITGYKFCLVTNSATTALLAAYNAIWPESKMLSMASLTFVATANMLFAATHHATLIDINLHTKVANGIDVGVSFAGHPVTGCTLADDAHSLFEGMVQLKNMTSVLSFHPAKIITTGEGGAILTNSERVYMNAQTMVDQGRLDRQGSFGYGFNFRMSGINAALGLSQLARLRENHTRRRVIVGRYRDGLAEFKDKIHLPRHHPLHSYHLFNILLPSKIHRDELRVFLAGHGIRTQIHYPPLDSYEHLKSRLNATRNAKIVYEHGVSLPLHLNLTDNQVDFIIDRLVFFFRRIYG